jgi:uncharacterized membrane protein YedE/YeeE
VSQHKPLAAGLLVGVVFGVVLCWSGMSSPNVIRQALLFQDSYLFLFFAAAVLTSFVGLRLVRGRRALLADERVDWKSQRPERRHIVGSLVFGLGWGIADACPGPIATQLGQGIWWSVFTFAGVLLGVRFFLRREQETEPASEPATGAADPAAARAPQATPV